MSGYSEYEKDTYFSGMLCLTHHSLSTSTVFSTGQELMCSLLNFRVC